MKRIEDLEKSKRKRIVGVCLKTLLGIFITLVVVMSCYIAYLFLSYNRIEDNQLQAVNLPSSGANSETVSTNNEYLIGTYNVGFGAYTPDYSFFMDGGKHSRCLSAQSASDTIDGAANLAASYSPDFMLFQEVDRDSRRSYHQNQEEKISNVFSDYYETFSVNYHSAFLFYPFNDPIGASYSGIATYSKYPITSSMRRSFTISTGFSKFLDLDRCYSVNRIPVDNGKELVIFNVHMSAYGNNDEIRRDQTAMLAQDMKKETDAGNYVICGGDFNHDLKAAESDTENCKSWTYPFLRSELPENLKFAMDSLTKEQLDAMPESNRDAGTPYQEGVTMVNTIDGFIISDNVTMVSYEIKDTGYLYSDHQPVVMTFKLN